MNLYFIYHMIEITCTSILILKKGEHLMIPRKKILTSYKKEDVIGWAKNDINLFFYKYKDLELDY